MRRPLSEDETDWAADLWFESDGLPLRFVQAAALLRQRDAERAGPPADDAYGTYAGPGAVGAYAAGGGHDVPLPARSETAAPPR
ncbi:hypothetical protein NKH77_36035 [Streptomyces sp. M19]